MTTDNIDSLMIGSMKGVEAISKTVYGATSVWHNITNPGQEITTEWDEAPEEYKESVRKAVRFGLTRKKNNPNLLHGQMTPDDQPLMDFHKMGDEIRMGFSIMAGIIDSINAYLTIKP